FRLLCGGLPLGAMRVRGVSAGGLGEPAPAPPRAGLGREVERRLLFDRRRLAGVASQGRDGARGRRQKRPRAAGGGGWGAGGRTAPAASIKKAPVRRASWNPPVAASARVECPARRSDVVRSVARAEKTARPRAAPSCVPVLRRPAASPALSSL